MCVRYVGWAILKRARHPDAIIGNSGIASDRQRAAGTEDYFCGSYNFENQQTHQYQEFSTPYAGMPQVIRGNAHEKMYDHAQRFGLYRWHIMDPVRFESDLSVTIQALGWRNGGRYLPLQDDIASVAYWYQTLPSAPFPKLPDKDYLEVV